MLSYPFRGTGGLLFWVYVGLLVFARAGGAIPGLGLLLGFFMFFVGFLVPGLLLAIIRTTAAGDDELPDWPDIHPFGERLGEWAGVVVSLMISLVPLAALLAFARCRPPVLGGGAWGGECRAVVAVGFFVALAWIVPSLGSIAVYGSPAYALRIDRHAVVLARGGGRVWGTIAFLAAEVALLGLAASLARRLPYLGWIFATALFVYLQFEAAHLVGLAFRRHGDWLDRVYGP